MVVNYAEILASLCKKPSLIPEPRTSRVPKISPVCLSCLRPRLPCQPTSHSLMAPSGFQLWLCAVHHPGLPSLPRLPHVLGVWKVLWDSSTVGLSSFCPSHSRGAGFDWLVFICCHSLVLFCSLCTELGVLQHWKPAPLFLSG